MENKTLFQATTKITHINVALTCYIWVCVGAFCVNLVYVYLKRLAVYRMIVVVCLNSVVVHYPVVDKKLNYVVLRRECVCVISCFGVL